MSIVKRTLAQKLGLITIAVAACAATVAAFGIAGVLLGIAISSTGWIHGEAASWFGLIAGFYGLLAGIVIGPIISWKILAGKLGVSRKVTLGVAIGLLVAIPVVEFSILHSPKMTGPSEPESRVDIEAVSNDGGLVIVEASRTASSVLYRINTHTGQATRLADTHSDFQEGAKLSPDNKQVVFTSRHQDGPSEIIVSDIDGNNLHQLLPESGRDSSPMFSHDGRLVYFARRTSQERYTRSFDMYSTNIDGTNVKELTHWNFDADEDI